MDRSTLEQLVVQLTTQELQLVHQLGEARGAMRMVKEMLSDLKKP